MARWARSTLSEDIVGELYCTFCETKMPSGATPTIREVLQFAPFKAVVEDRDAAEEVCAADFAGAVQQLPQLIKEWQRSATG